MWFGADWVRTPTLRREVLRRRTPLHRLRRRGCVPVPLGGELQGTWLVWLLGNGPFRSNPGGGAYLYLQERRAELGKLMAEIDVTGAIGTRRDEAIGRLERLVSKVLGCARNFARFAYT